MILYTCLFSRSTAKQMGAGMRAPLPSRNCKSVIREGPSIMRSGDVPLAGPTGGIQGEQQEK